MELILNNTRLTWRRNLFEIIHALKDGICSINNTRLKMEYIQNNTSLKAEYILNNTSLKTEFILNNTRLRRNLIGIIELKDRIYLK
jgi:hypothetical protein